MNLWRSVAGSVEAELTTADPEGIFEILTDAGITLEKLQQTDVLTYGFSVSRKDCRKTAEICKKRGDSLSVQKKTGLYWYLKKQMNRPMFYGGILLLLLIFWLPTRVLFISVDGNKDIPAKRILEAAESSGITFGASRKDVRSERVKNALLEEIPELQWIGINTSGCRAVISVREKQRIKEEAESDLPASIIAARDGYLISCTANKGTLMVAPGQTVQKGQILISAYTDCGFCIRTERAEGEVTAHTNREVEIISPVLQTEKLPAGKVKRKISLLFRKKRIFLWKDSGIWDGSCGRMYEEYYITLPGGFRLPAGLCVESFYPYEKAETECDPAATETALRIFGKEYLSGLMIAGRILGENVTVTQERECYRLTGEYTCLEMIGQRRQEQIGDLNGKNS